VNPSVGDELGDLVADVVLAKLFVHLINDDHLVYVIEGTLDIETNDTCDISLAQLLLLRDTFALQFETQSMSDYTFTTSLQIRSWRPLFLVKPN